MANKSIKATLANSYAEGRYSFQVAHTPDPVAAATTADNDAGTAAGTLTTNVAAAVAALVADGASPTQGHVNTLNTAWGLLATAIATAKTSTAAAKVAVSYNVTITFDTSVITTKNALRAAVQQALRAVEGSDDLT